MSVKFTRGLANTATCIVELPKQIILTSKDKGPAMGAVIGPVKGIGMTVYRAFAGVIETVFFMVPQPGYYDPMINPDFVWKGWEGIDSEVRKVNEAESMENSGGTKGE
jgi:putative exosortase-associated protein (TIGR04073 family)